MSPNVRSHEEFTASLNGVKIDEGTAKVRGTAFHEACSLLSDEQEERLCCFSGHNYKDPSELMHKMWNLEKAHVDGRDFQGSDGVYKALKILNFFMNTASPVADFQTPVALAFGLIKTVTTVSASTIPHSAAMPSSI